MTADTLHFDVVADILQSASTGATIGKGAVLASRGSVTLQDMFTRQAKAALREHGLPVRGADPVRLREVADQLRQEPAPTSSPEDVAGVLRRAADWLAGLEYGPTRHRPGGDIIEAVEHVATGRELYDALSAIAAAVHPAATITDWEWNVNRSHEGAVGLLRSLVMLPGGE